MILWLISHLDASWSTQALLEAARSKGHTAELFHPRDFHIGYTESGVLELCREQAGSALPDVVLTRLGSSSPISGLHLLRQFELLGVRCVNTTEGLEISRDKLRSMQELGAKGIPQPAARLVSPRATIESLLDGFPGPPWVVKLPVSSQGKGVILVETLAGLRSTLDLLHGLHAPILLQEYIREAQGCDIRALVVGGSVVASMRRRAASGEFRSNLHAGGAPEKYVATAEVVALAQHAAKALSLPIAGVDILESARGPLVLEVNGSPGFEGLQKVTELDIAQCIIAYVTG